MKRFIFFTLLSIMLCTGCTDTIEGLDVSDVITTSVENIDSECLGSKTTVEVNAYCDWDISSSENWDWIKVSHKTGSKGKTSLEITVEPNTTVNERIATLTIYNRKYNISRNIEVSQGNSTPFISASDKDLSFTYKEETQSITIMSNIDWSAIVSDSEWLTITPTKGELGKTTMKIVVEQNSDIFDRKATITLSGTDKYDKVKEEITILQHNNGPYITPSVNELKVENDGGNKSVTIDSNVSWEASCSADWVTISPTKAGNGVTDLQITIKRYGPSHQKRTATIELESTDKDLNASCKIVITQAESLPYISVTRKNIDTTADGGSESVTIDSNVSWKASCKADWVTISPTKAGSGITDMQITIKSNGLSQEKRTATIEFESTDKDLNASCKVIISQAAGIPYISVSKNNVEFTAVGGSESVSVSSNCIWYVTCTADWIYGLPSVVNGNSTITIKALTNNEDTDREAKVTISNSELNVKEEITVKQSAAYLIRYTTNDNSIIPGIAEHNWGANIISHTYGIIAFDKPVTKIPDEAFSWSRLQSIVIPNSVTGIGEGAFSGCESLLDIAIPKSVTEIGNNAFDGCLGLSNIELPENLKKIGAYAFSSTSLESITIPQNITEINEGTFWMCDKLESITIPQAVTEIGRNAFAYCNITKIQLPENLKKIGTSAFANTYLESITIPQSVTELGERIFYGCYQLGSIYCKPHTPPTWLEGNPFTIDPYYDDYIGIYVPRSSVDLYKESWPTVASRIKEYDF